MTIRGIATMAGGIRYKIQQCSGIKWFAYIYVPSKRWLSQNPLMWTLYIPALKKISTSFIQAIHHFMPLVGGSNWLNQQLTKVNWAGRHKLWEWKPTTAGCCRAMVYVNHDFKPTIEQVADSIAVFFAEEMNTTNLNLPFHNQKSKCILILLPILYI